MNSASSHRLCVLVEPYDDESFLSLIARTAKANAFKRTGQILALAGVSTLSPAHAPFSKIAHAEGIAHLLSLSEDKVRLRMHPTVVRVGMVQSVDWYGTPLARNFIDAGTRRYSNATLLTDEFHRAISMIKPISFSPLTGEMFESRCPHCAHGLGWANANGNSFCDLCKKCLYVPKDTAKGAISANVLDDCIEAANLVNTNPHVRNLALTKLPKPFREWEAGDAFTAIVELGVTSCELSAESGKYLSGRIGKGEFSAYAPAHLAWGYQVVRGWPTTINEYLHKEVGKSSYNALRLHNPLGKFFAPHSPNSPFQTLLHSHVLENGFVRRSQMRFGSKQQKSGIEQQQFYGNTVEACERFDVCKATLHRLRNKGDCFVFEGRSRDSMTRYDFEKLSKSIELLRSSMLAAKCERILGLPSFCFPALAAADLVERVTDNDACLLAQGNLFRSASVEALATLFRSLPLLEGRNTGVTISKALLRRFNPSDWTDVVSQLVLGNISVVGRNSRAKNSLDELIVDSDDVETVLASLPNRELPQDIFVSNVVAGKLMGVQDFAIGLALGAGLLRGFKNGRYTQTSLVELEAFHRNYVMTSEGSIAIGVSQQMFHWKLREHGLQPALWHRRFCVWKRDEAEAVFQRILMGEQPAAPESENAK